MISKFSLHFIRHHIARNYHFKHFYFHLFSEMKMAWQEKMMSGDDKKPSEKDMMKMKMMLKMKVGFMKMAIDTFWTLKKLKGIIKILSI